MDAHAAGMFPSLSDGVRYSFVTHFVVVAAVRTNSLNEVAI